MITIEDIKDNSKAHSPLGGSKTVIKYKNILISIVGGRRGLYGDFDKDFEIAIISDKTKDFVTRFYNPESHDDVMAYVPGDEMMKFINKIVKGKSFRFL